MKSVTAVVLLMIFVVWGLCRLNRGNEAGLVVFVDSPVLPGNSVDTRGYFITLFNELAAERAIVKQVAGELCPAGPLEGFSVSVYRRAASKGVFELCFSSRSNVPAEDFARRFLERVEERMKERARALVLEAIRRKEALLRTLAAREELVDERRHVMALERHIASVTTDLSVLRGLLDRPGPFLRRVRSVACPSGRRPAAGYSVNFLPWLLMILAAVTILVYRFRPGFLPGSRGSGEHRSGASIEVDAELPVVAVIPELDDSLVMGNQPFGRGAEAFRRLRTELLLAGASRVVMTSIGSGQGVSTVSANLALAFGETGLDVLLVDGNMRRPSIHLIFDLDNDEGLSDVLIDTEPGDVLWNADELPVSIITSGPRPPDPAALLAGDGMERLFRHGSDDGGSPGLIIVDAPPLELCADALAFGFKSDGLLLIGAGDEVSAARMNAEVRRVAGRGLKVLGIVMNRVRAGSTMEEYDFRLGPIVADDSAGIQATWSKRPV